MCGNCKTKEKMNTLQVEYKQIGRHSERAIIDNTIIDIDRQFNCFNRVCGATITFKKLNDDNRTLSVLRILSNYKSFSDAKKNVLLELEKLNNI